MKIILKNASLEFQKRFPIMDETASATPLSGFKGVAFFQGNFLAGHKYTFTLSTKDTISGTFLGFFVSSGITGPGLTDAYQKAFISDENSSSFSGERILEWTPQQDYNNFYARLVADGLEANDYVINLHAIAY